MLAKLDSPTRRNIVDDLLRDAAAAQGPVWKVTCTLTRRETFGTVTVETHTWQRAFTEADALDQGSLRACRVHPGYRLDAATARRTHSGSAEL